MRIRTITVPALGLLLAASAAGCVSAAKVNQTAISQPPAAPGHSAGPAAAPKKAGLGAAIALKGQHNESIQITLVKVIDPGVSSDQFMTPDPGKRYVGLQFRILNVGTVTYSDAPDNDVKALDAQGQSYDPEIAAQIEGGQPFSSNMNIAPGGSELGIEVFALPTGVKVATVQYGIDSGFGDAAQWALG